MTNFCCIFCGDKMEVPPEIRKVVSAVTHAFWHDWCIDNPEYELTIEQKKFWHKMGIGGEF